jgi:uncharacterized protein (DUF885 family)
MRLSFLILALFTTHLAYGKPDCGRFVKSVMRGTAAQKLKRFLDVQWEHLMKEYPEWATSVGYPGQDDRWMDRSLAAFERRRESLLCQKEALSRIVRARLPTKDKITYDLAVYNLEQNIESESFDDKYMPINHLDGVHVGWVDTLTSMPTAKVRDFENILKRLERIPAFEEQIVVLMREGMKRKVTPVKAFLSKVIGQVNAMMPADVEAGPLFKPFSDIPETIPTAEKSSLQAKAREVIANKVYPALRHLNEFLQKDYIPHAREFIALSDMPNGKAWYAFAVKSNTTTDLTADQIHELGLREVTRIMGEMNKIREQLKFKGNLRAFNTYLLNDKRFRYDKPEDALTGYRDVAKRIDPELPRLFKTLPRLTYGVRAIEAFRAASAPKGQYNSGSLQTGRPGWFVANTYDLPSNQKWDMETLTLHETVPGHHLQISLAQEIEDLPEFRRNGQFTAFTEGWALYAESLGSELGLFKDPLSLYGHLAAEMMRAIRLVLDTGMHAKGWTKERALAFYRDNMPITDLDSEIEVDRYITWPGQALAYKVGQLKFRELRQWSQEALGNAFDIREFHDAVLLNGALPMPVLEKVVREWVRTKRPLVKNAGQKRAEH